MANPARSEVASACRLTRRRVTNITLTMRVEGRWNRKRSSAIRSRSVTSAATILRSDGGAHVLCVVKLHVEAFFEVGGKTFERRLRCVDVRMADDAHGNRGCEELIAM